MSRLPAAVLLASCLALLISGGQSAHVDWWLRGQPLSLGAPPGALRVAVDASYPPFAAAEADGTLWGLEVDVARAVATRLGVDVELQNVDAGSGLDALPAGAYDAMLAGIVFEPSMTAQVRFSRGYFDAGPVLLGTPSVPGTPRHVAVEVGSPWSDEVAALTAAGASVEQVWELDEAIQRVRQRELDAVLLDRPTALERLRDERDLSLHALGNREAYGLRIALARPNRSLSFAVDEALLRLERDGTLAMIERRWFGASRGD